MVSGILQQKNTSASVPWGSVTGKQCHCIASVPPPFSSSLTYWHTTKKSLHALHLKIASVSRISSTSWRSWLSLPEVSLRRWLHLGWCLATAVRRLSAQHENKIHPNRFSCQPKRHAPAERRWIERLYCPKRQSRVAIREICTLEGTAGALFLSYLATVWRFFSPLPAQRRYKENSRYKVLAFFFHFSPLCSLFTSQQ